MGNKAKPISLNILDIAQRVNKLEKSGGGGGGGGAADDVTYDPTASGLQATNVQDAIDELSSDIFEMSADDVSYDNTDSGLSSETVQGAIDETVNKIDNVNDDLNGFKFYPAGTAIVGLVSDDSPYTDADGNYILAASTTGQSMIDDVTYKSINSSIDARGKVGADSATPFKSGGGSDEAPTLLWTNSDPTAGFSPQTVALNLTSYKTIGILYRSSASVSGQTAFAFYPMGANITIPTTISGYPDIINAGYGQTTSMKATGRNITISGAGIVFGSGYSAESGSSNNYGIPVKIYGIKYQIYPSNI